MISIPIECPKWLHRQLAEDAQRNGMTLEDWAGTLLAQYMYCEKEKTMELDMTKPMRFKANKLQCWPSGMPVDGNYICVTYWDINNNSQCSFCAPSLVENIPEPVKHTFDVHLTNRGDLFCSHSTDSDDPAWKDAKLTVWRDEEGRTHVEVEGE